MSDLKYWLSLNTWFRNRPTSKPMDIWINQLADNNKFEKLSYHTAKLGDYVFWISNYPYDCFVPYVQDMPNLVSLELGMPSRKTVLRLRKKLFNDLLLRK